MSPPIAYRMPMSSRVVHYSIDEHGPGVRFERSRGQPEGAVMANVFISHAGADSGWAKQVHGWLKEDGHEVFLDRDRNDGVLPGEEWERLLYSQLREADAVVCVVTASYVKSVWCAMNR